jgi:hypothetical protein
MNTYLERLKARDRQIHTAGQPSKPSKAGLPTLLKVLKGRHVGVLADEHVDGRCEFEECAAICEHDGGLSRDYAEQLAALHAVPLPDGITEQQRTTIIDAVALFAERRRERKPPK